MCTAHASCLGPLRNHTSSQYLIPPLSLVLGRVADAEQAMWMQSVIYSSSTTDDSRGLEVYKLHIVVYLSHDRDFSLNLVVISYARQLLIILYQAA